LPRDAGASRAARDRDPATVERDGGDERPTAERDGGGQRPTVERDSGGQRPTVERDSGGQRASAERDRSGERARTARDARAAPDERLTFAPVRIKRRSPRVAGKARRPRPPRPATAPPAAASDRRPPRREDGLLDPFVAEDRAVSRRQQRARLAELGRRARARGLWPGDDPAFDQLWRQARQAVERGSGEAEIQRLQQWVAAFEPDAAFVQRKLARLERRIAAARIDEARRRSVTARSQQILRLLLDDRAVEASRQISALLAELK
jgi:hypothetical protein